MEIKIRVEKGGILPKYSKEGDAAMDIVAISKEMVDKSDFGYIEYGTGLYFELPKGYYMDIRPRSSISTTGMILANSPGTLDSKYTGELKLRFKWIPGTIQYEIGERIAQIMILPYPTIEFIEVKEIAPTDRGEDGFGSTGK